MRRAWFNDRTSAVTEPPCGNVAEPEAPLQPHTEASMSDTQLQAAIAHAEKNEIEQVARDISHLARKLTVEIDRARRLPEELVTVLRGSGLLRAGAPLEAEGLE